MTVETYEPQVVTLTDSAIAHFRNVLADGGGSVIRLKLETSGCTGYAYVLELAHTVHLSDFVVDCGEFKFGVDFHAKDIVFGTEIDYVTEGFNQVIKYNNPNISAECGCGESFNV